MNFAALIARFATDLVPGASRDTVDDVLDDAFGRSYGREMKGVLRGAFREGLRRSNVPDEILDGLVDERMIDRVWRTQQKYTNRLRNDLKTELAAGRVGSVTDLERWFGENDYRSVMTGRFMGWQGLNAGVARAAEHRGNKLRWRLGVREEHCNVCLGRSGRTFAYDELVAIGMPASDRLPCKAACGCLVEEA